jgi:hypothetical protein
LLLDVVIETVELVPEEVEAAETALPSKGAAVLVPLTEKTSASNPPLLEGAVKVITSLESVPEETAYQHFISPPLDEETVPLAVHVRPLVSEMPNVSPVVSVYSHA